MFKQINIIYINILKKEGVFPPLHSLFAGIVISSVVLSGCAATETTNTAKPEKTTAEFQDWVIEDCQLKSRNNQITISTDGHESHQTIRVSLKLPSPPQGPPLISILVAGSYDINQTGRNKNWSFELPNSPFATAQMMAGRVYVVTEYTPEPDYRNPAPQPQTATFGLKELPEALLRLHKKCEN